MQKALPTHSCIHSQVLSELSLPLGSVDTREPYFTKNFHSVSHARGLTEADARDVYYHGSTVKENMMVRQYNGYEIGIYFFVDGHSGRTIITSIWKRERR